MTGPRQRLFIALDLPPEARDAIVRWAQGALAGRPDLRLLAPESLHVTLAFLGERDPAETRGALAALAALRGLPAPRMALGAPAWLPARRPRLAVVDLADDGGGAGALHGRVWTALAEQIGAERDPRPFRPHVTVARLRRGATGRQAALPAPPRIAFRAPSAGLFASHTGRGAARYDLVAREALDG